MAQQLAQYQSPTGSNPTGGGPLLRLGGVGNVWVWRATSTYSTLVAGEFLGLVPAGDIIIAIFTDPVTHVLQIGPTGAVETVF